MEDLSTHFLSADEISELFGDEAAEQAKEVIEEENDQEQEEIKNKQDENNNTTDEEQPQESGGRKSNQEDTDSAGSPNNFFTSIAKALKEEGIFPDLDKIDDIKDAASLKKMFEEQVDSRLSQQQKRVVEALNYGIEEPEIQKFERTIHYLDSIKESDITAENSDGENLRKNLIFRDYINRGFSEDRAKKEVEKSLNAGTDINDAKEALASNKEYFGKQYKFLLDKAKQENEAEIAAKNKRIEEMKKAIDEQEAAFGSITIDKATRNKIFENLTKPVEKDSNGELLTPMQKYERENGKKFLVEVATLFTLTDGFTDYSKLFKTVENKAVKKGLSNLEDVLKGSVNTESGSLSVMGGSSDNYFSQDFEIDL